MTGRTPKRRSVLKSIGAAAVGVPMMSGTASAKRNNASAKGNNYGNGNGIGAFLNEEAMFKPSPVWDTGVANRTDQDEVDVLWGGLTDVIHPGTGETVPGPWGVDPRAVVVSPGTDVTWTWWPGDEEFEAIDAHHLVSYFDPPYDDEFPHIFAGDPHEHPGGDDEFLVHKALGESYTYTFEEAGTYLYFCYPHGTPYEIDLSAPDEPEFIAENFFGQRGAVIVTDD